MIFNLKFLTLKYMLSKLKLMTFIIVITLIMSGCSLATDSGISDVDNSSGQAPGQDENGGDNMDVQVIENNETEENSIVTLKTSLGEIKIELFAQDAPATVQNFLKLAESGFYDGTIFHRVIPDFIIQGGDPLSKDGDPLNDGTGGPGYMFDDEINQNKIVRGSLAMANAGPNTNGSQFFIVTVQAAPWLDGLHTVFGKVLEGMPIADVISLVERDGRDRPLQDVVIESVTIE